ncbi:hypothetical protein [Flavobacterium sp. LB2P74]|uniref:hypothetical protein n=1 Tax=Flavobacterium sp. LB2P74 TaxID=3401717 RepID=UPI003AAD574F
MNSIRNKNKKNWLFLLLAFFALGAFYPFVHNYLFFGDLKVYISLFFLVIWIALMLIFNKQIILPASVFNKIVFIQVIFLFFAGIIYDSESIFIQMLNLGLSWVFLWVLLNTITIKFFIKNFILANILSAVLILIGTIAFAIGKLNIVSEFKYQNTTIINFGYFFVKKASEIDNQFRPAGYYDEAGTFAYVVMFLLLLNRKYFQNMKWEYALIFLPLFTTSMAHIFTIFIFGALFHLNKNNIIKMMIFVGIFGVMILFFANTFSAEKSEILKEKTIGRFTDFISGGEDAGRQGGLDLGLKIFNKNSFGVSKEDVSRDYPEFVHETFWGPIIYFGIFGIGFYLLPFLYIGLTAIRKKDKFTIFMLLIVFINLLQRPSYIAPLYIILIYSLFFNENIALSKIRKNQLI